MKCPRDQHDLLTQTINGHEIDKCPKCEGLSISTSGIDKLLGPGQMLQLRSLCSIRESKLPCPSGCRRMSEGKVGSVVLDMCQDCGRLWLDPGELKTLQQRKGITPHQSSEPTKEPFRADIGLSTELAILGLLALT